MEASSPQLLGDAPEEPPLPSAAGPGGLRDLPVPVSDRHEPA